jgi:hypothetical protein
MFAIKEIFVFFLNLGVEIDNIQIPYLIDKTNELVVNYKLLSTQEYNRDEILNQQHYYNRNNILLQIINLYIPQNDDYIINGIDVFEYLERILN